MKTRASALCLVVVVLSLFAACSPGGPPRTAGSGQPMPPFEGEPPAEPYIFEGEPGTYGGVLVTSAISDPRSFNPITASETSTTSIFNGPVYTPLLGFDNIAQEANSGLTTRHDVTPDGLVYTFYIRKGIRWSDGQPFSANDVKFTFDVAFDPKIDNSIKSSFVQSDGTYPTVDVLDDHTVRFTFKEPNPLTIDNIGSTYLVPRHRWESAWRGGTFGDVLGIDTPTADVVGLGPYRLKEFVSGQKVELERNPYYWKVDTRGQRLPYIDRVVFTIVPDMNVMLARFQAGESDMMWNVRPEEVDLLRAGEQQGGYTVHDLGAGFNYNYFAVNQNTRRNPAGKPYVDPVKSAWFTNVKFRQAISYAIDRESIIKTLLQGRGVPVFSFIPPANKKWYSDEAVIKYPHDVERARALLREIGIEDRNGDGTAEDAQGNNVEFRLMTNANNPTRVQMATLIKDNLKQVGINVNFQALEFNSMSTMLRETWDWESVIGGWQSANPPDPILGKNILLSSGDVHYPNPSQPAPATEWERQIDEIIQLNARTLDPALRKEQINQAVRLWSENLPEIELYAANYYVAAKHRVKNMRPSPLPLYTYWNIDELYMAP